jgi:hypothetical protein
MVPLNGDIVAELLSRTPPCNVIADTVEDILGLIFLPVIERVIPDELSPTKENVGMIIVQIFPIIRYPIFRPVEALVL